MKNKRDPKKVREPIYIDNNVIMLIKVLLSIVIGALVEFFVFMLFNNSHPELAQKIIVFLNGINLKGYGY